MILGVMLFFDGALLALGNVHIYVTVIRKNHLTHSLLQILFISGLTFIIGPQKTFYFFARKQKLRGTLCFFGGILLVFFKHPFIGMIVETFGFLNLFGLVLLPLLPRCNCSFHSTSDFFPVVITFLRQLPFIGTFLTLPYIRTVCITSLLLSSLCLIVE